ncbi:hypothetical protein MRX96_053967 [Rhipicephalus microplus]
MAQEQNTSVTAENFDSGQDFTWYALQTCHGRDFIVMLKKSSENSSFKHCFAVVVLVGSSEDAQRFQYRLQVSGSNHRLTLEARMKGIPLPGREFPERRWPDLQQKHGRALLQWWESQNGRHHQYLAVVWCLKIALWASSLNDCKRRRRMA